MKIGINNNNGGLNFQTKKYNTLNNYNVGSFLPLSCIYQTVTYIDILKQHAIITTPCIKINF